MKHISFFVHIPTNSEEGCNSLARKVFQLVRWEETLQNTKLTLSAIIGIADGFSQDNGVVCTSRSVDAQVREYVVKDIFLFVWKSATMRNIV